MPPEAADLPPAPAMHLHLDPTAGQPAGSEPGVQVLGKRLGREHNRLGLLGRRVELISHGQVGGGRAGSQGPRIQSAGQSVRELAGCPEPVRRLGGGQRRELSQGGDAQPGQQVAELGAAQRADGLGGEERHRPAGRHDAGIRSGPAVWSQRGGQFGGEQPVRDTDLAGEASRAHRRRDLPDELGFPAEAPGGPADADRAGPRPEHLYLRAEFLDYGDHRLENPGPRPRPGARPRSPGCPGCAARFWLRIRPVRAVQDENPLRYPWPGHPVPARASLARTAARADLVSRTSPASPARPASLASAASLASPAFQARPAFPASPASRLIAAITWSGAARTLPSGPGSQSHADRARAPAFRPSATIRARRARRRPCPAPIPAHSWSAISSRAWAPSHSPATRSTLPKRRAAASSLRRNWAAGRAGGRSRTTSQPSSSDATTCGQLAPGSATRSSRSGSRPASAAARTPSDGRPTAAHQAPAADAAAASARNSSPP